MKDEALKAMLDGLAQLPATDNYSENDRYRDFRKTFSSTEGQKVLRHIVELGGVFSEPVIQSPIDPLVLAVHRGRRQLALGIFAIYNNEPREKQTKATRKQTKR